VQGATFFYLNAKKYTTFATTKRDILQNFPVYFPPFGDFLGGSRPWPFALSFEFLIFVCLAAQTDGK
jgi:hypothetical protein